MLVGGSPEVNPIHDFGWYRQHLYIQDRLTHELIQLRPTLIQLRVRRAILDAEAARIPARIIVLKARREGVSTITQATFAHRAFTRRNVNTYTIAHETDAASILFGMTETMYANLPAALRPPKASGNLGKRLVLGNGSDLRTETAKDVQAGRSSAASLLHCSEVGFWDHGDKVLRSMLSIVPDAPGTVIIMESTANGMENAFHRRWRSAERGDSGYTPLFFSWLEDPVYSLGEITWEALGPLDDEEDALKEILHAQPGQLKWRREIIRTQFDGDLDGFHQEFPSTPVEAFITSGRQFFGANYISRFHPREPITRARLKGVWRKRAEVWAEPDDRGPLWVYEKRNSEHRYVLFVDPAGVVGDNRARFFRTGDDPSDYTCMWVLDCVTMNTAAVWHERIDLGLIAEEAAKLGRIYNNAVICPEMTGGYGATVIVGLRALGYSALHRDRTRDTYNRPVSERYGWTTSVATRPLMLETLRDVLRETPEKLADAGLREEMLNFVIGRVHAAAAPGAHDDRVMAAAGAYIVGQEYAQRKPIKLIGAPEKKRRRRPRRYTDVLTRAQG